MAALVRAFPADNLHVMDLPYRFSSWAFDDPRNVALWVDEAGQLAAWAVLQTPFWALDYAYRPDAGPDVHPQILAWADARARAALDTDYGRPIWFVNVFTGQAERRRDLEQAGFASQAEVGEDSWSKVLLRRLGDAGVPAAPALPPGYSLRPLAGEVECLGLGRAILSEAVRRLASLVAAHVDVETDSYRNAAFELYEAVGFRVIQDVLVYRKDYGAALG